jgi:hypothetical protein
MEAVAGQTKEEDLLFFTYTRKYTGKRQKAA